MRKTMIRQAHHGMIRQDHHAINHPCFNLEASKKHGRIHLPIAPECNISCNYCNRKYNCRNENRPGVTAMVLSPEEAMDMVRYCLKTMPHITTAGIAGPGDSLANFPETFKVLENIRREFPALNLCLSTNGLMLADYFPELCALKVGYITMTINSLDVAVAEKIYPWVKYEGNVFHGREGAGLLLEKQKEGLLKLKEKGNIFLKVNILYIPGINEDEVEKTARFAKENGASLVNIMPLIPAAGSVFENITRPSSCDLQRIKNSLGAEHNLMGHCRQCRSDAAGLL